MVHPPQQIRVSGRTNCKDLAHSLYKHLEVGTRLRLIAIGTQAINQAIKAVCILNSRVASHGEIYTVLPGMTDIEIRDEQTGTDLGRTSTAMVLNLIPHVF